MDERRRIFGLHYRVALQRREGALVTHAIGTVAGRAVIHVQRRAGLAVIALPQILRYAVFNRRRGLFSTARRQRFQIAGNRGDIVVREILQAVFHYIAHSPEDHGLIVTPGFQELRQFGFAPGAQTVPIFAAQAGSHPAVNRRIAACQIVVTLAFAKRFFLHRQATRSVAGPAVTESLHQIAPALQHRVDLRIRDKIGRRRSEDPAPERQRPAH